MSHKIDLHLLSCLDALISEAHVTRAAERMGMSQPAMSNALSRLRDLFADPLLVRTPNGMLPTERAEKIIEAIRPALLTIDAQILGNKAFELARTNATFNIMTTDYGALIVLPKLLKRLATEAPGIKIGIQYSKPHMVREQLENGTTNLVVGFFQELPVGLYSSVIERGEIVCITRRDRFPKGEGLTVEQYRKARHAYFGGADTGVVSTIESLIDRECDVLGFRRTTVVRTVNAMVLPHLVADSDLLAALPRPAAERLSKGLDVDILGLPFLVPEFRMAIVWHDRAHRDPAQKWLRGAVRAAVSSTP